MNFPDIITRLPEADVSYGSADVKTNVLQSSQGQVVFFDILTDTLVPAHSHKTQWGIVLEGQLELTIGDDTRIYGAGTTYYVPPGVVHSAKVSGGTKLIDFFEEPDRYQLKQPSQ